LAKETPKFTGTGEIKKNAMDALSA